MNKLDYGGIMVIQLTKMILENKISIFKNENKMCIISPNKLLNDNDIIELFEDFYKITLSNDITFDTDFVFNNNDFVVEKYILKKINNNSIGCNNE